MENLIVKKILKGYISFENEAKIENMHSVIKKGFSKNAQWACRITDYENLKSFKREFFDFEDDNEIEVAKLNVGDVVNFRKQKKESNKYCLQYDGIYYVKDIGVLEVELIELSTIASAIKYQKKMSI
jgi:hypothetical protein